MSSRRLSILRYYVCVLPGGLSVSMVIPVGSTWGGNASYRSGSSSSTADNITEGIPQQPDTHY